MLRFRVCVSSFQAYLEAVNPFAHKAAGDQNALIMMCTYVFLNFSIYFDINARFLPGVGAGLKLPD